LLADGIMADGSPSDVSIVEIKLLHLLGDSLSATDKGATPSLAIQYRDPPASLLVTHAASDICNDQNEMPMFGMAAVKSHLAPWVKERGLSEDLVTKAIYGLVAKGLLKIDRRTARDPLVYFDP
jgi:hypothetical protein